MRPGHETNKSNDAQGRESSDSDTKPGNMDCDAVRRVRTCAAPEQNYYHDLPPQHCITVLVARDDMANPHAMAMVPRTPLALFTDGRTLAILHRACKSIRAIKGVQVYIPFLRHKVSGSCPGEPAKAGGTPISGLRGSRSHDPGHCVSGSTPNPVLNT